MEPHPVPQNFLSTEFKLFGAFTLNQFIRMLLGGIVAVGIFFIDINFLIKLPLIIAAVGIGILTAIIPNFETWIFGYIKAIFISPRYVWQKQKVMPEVLNSPTVNQSKDKGLESALDKKLVDLEKLPLDKLFGSAIKVEENEEKDELERENVSAVYEDVFGKNVIDPNRKITDYDQVVSPEASQQSNAAVAQDRNKPEFNNIDDYRAELRRLKFELSKFAGKDTDKERQITEQINDLYMEVKVLLNDNKFKSTPEIHQKLTQLKPVVEGKVLVGIVVNKSDLPISGAQVDFVREERVVARGETSIEGKFSLTEAVPFGEYDVKISHPQKRFHTYRISVADGNPTGFKFREK